MNASSQTGVIHVTKCHETINNWSNCDEIIKEFCASANVFQQ